MKRLLQKFVTFCSAVIMSSATFRISAADVTPTGPTNEVPELTKTYTGNIIDLDAGKQKVQVVNWTMFHKTFDLELGWTYLLSSNRSGSFDDLRSGEKVTVTYHKFHGDLLADSIAFVPMTFEGRVLMIDPVTHQMVIHQPGLDKALVIANGCKVFLSNQQTGSLANIQIADHVVATYEMPDEVPTIRQIDLTSIEFSGTVTAIDAHNRTLTANSALGDKQFVIGDDCSLVIDGHPKARFKDLKPNDKLTFSYDEIKGVDILNRIGSQPTNTNTIVYSDSPSKN